MRGVLGPGRRLPERRRDDRLGLPRDGRRRKPGQRKHARHGLLQPGQLRRARLGQRRTPEDHFEMMRPNLAATTRRGWLAGAGAALVLATSACTPPPPAPAVQCTSSTIAAVAVKKA